ncbi:lysozyme inhibitor LprI family protein [Halopseudomonas pelagia]|nr:lysozyme inhibitor LprI family protein [Halopseudomonas pelagia]
MVLCGLQAAQGASFDCGKASNFAERTICTVESLSLIDDQLASIYQESLLYSSDQEALRQEQRDWLRSRDACEADAICLQREMSDRHIALLGIVQQQGEDQQRVAPAVSTQSSSHSLSPATAVIEQPLVNPPGHNVTTQDLIPESNSSQLGSLAAEPIIHTAAYVPPMRGSDSPVPNFDVPIEATSNGNDQSMLLKLALKLTAVALLLIVLVSIWLHHDGRLTIYSDYTDAAYTSAAPLIGLLVYWLASWLEVPEAPAKITGIVVFAGLMVQVVKSTYQQNGMSGRFVLALVTKMAVIGVYYIIMAVLLAGMCSNGRKKGESQRAYEARCRREAREARAGMVAVTTGFVFLSGWICRDKQFTDFGRYLKP